MSDAAVPEPSSRSTEPSAPEPTGPPSPRAPGASDAPSRASGASDAPSLALDASESTSSRDAEPTPHSSPGTAPAAGPAIRASDAERERIAEIVRGAVGDGRLTVVEGDERLTGIYAVTYRGELAPFVADLEVPEGSPAPTPSRYVPTVPERRTSIAVMGGVNRQGVWAPGASHTVATVMGGAELLFAHAELDPTGVTVTVVAVMGGSKIDLRGAPIGPGGLTVRVFALMGGAEVVVDGDTLVHETGFGFMGAFSDESGPPIRPGGPTVTVTGFALMGGVNVKRG